MIFIDYQLFMAIGAGNYCLILAHYCSKVAQTYEPGFQNFKIVGIIFGWLTEHYRKYKIEFSRRGNVIEIRAEKAKFSFSRHKVGTEFWFLQSRVL
jgi:hypothetical protein